MDCKAALSVRCRRWPLPSFAAFSLYERIPEDQIPEGVSEFHFTIKPLDGRQASISQQSHVDIIMASQGGESEEAIEKTKRKGAEQRLDSVVLSIGSWNYVAEDGTTPIPIERSILLGIQPGWLLRRIEDASALVNSPSKNSGSG